MNSTNINNMQKSRRRTLLAVISIVCVIVTAFGAVSFALSSIFTSSAESSSMFDGIYTDSAKAVDFENAVYRIDDNGNVWEESDESIRLVLKKEGALLIAVYDSCIYVLTENDSGEYMLSRLDIVNGLLSGNFYSSTGPVIDELYVEDGKVYIKCSDAKRISYSTRGRRTQAVNATEGYVTEACFEIREADEYFRIDVLDGEGNRANTQAYYIAEL